MMSLCCLISTLFMGLFDVAAVATSVFEALPLLGVSLVFAISGKYTVEIILTAVSIPIELFYLLINVLLITSFRVASVLILAIKWVMSLLLCLLILVFFAASLVFFCVASYLCWIPDGLYTLLSFTLPLTKICL